MIKKITLCLLGATLATNAMALPIDQIVINNQTPLAMTTSVSGAPGQGVPANGIRIVNYYLLNAACYYSADKLNCPIEFTDATTKAKVASIYINADTGTLTQPPKFYGSYSNEYDVTGWEASPIREINIVRKG